MGKSKKQSKQTSSRNKLILKVVPTVFVFSTILLLLITFILVGLGGIRTEDTALLLAPFMVSIVSLVLIKSTKTSFRKVFIGWFQLNFPNVFS